MATAQNAPPVTATGVYLRGALTVFLTPVPRVPWFYMSLDALRYAIAAAF